MVFQGAVMRSQIYVLKNHLTVCHVQYDFIYMSADVKAMAFYATMVGLVLPVLRSRSWSRKESHHLVGAGAVTRCGSGSDRSGSDNGIYHD
jgi:hypothetical protein